MRLALCKCIYTGNQVNFHLGGIRRSFDFPMLMVNPSLWKGTPTLVTWLSQAWRYIPVFADYTLLLLRQI